MEHLSANADASASNPRARRLIQLPARRDDTYRVRPHLYRTMLQVAPGLLAAFDGLRDGRSPWPLYLHGKVGRGKTRACLWLADMVEFGRLWSVEEIMRLMLANQAPWEWYPTTPRLAILDELGMHDPTRDFEFDAVKGFADWREDRPAVYVSNQPPKRIQELYDQRIASRVLCGTVYELTGADRRFEK